MPKGLRKDGSFYLRSVGKISSRNVHKHETRQLWQNKSPEKTTVLFSDVSEVSRNTYTPFCIIAMAQSL